MYLLRSLVASLLYNRLIARSTDYSIFCAGRRAQEWTRQHEERDALYGHRGWLTASAARTAGERMLARDGQRDGRTR